MSHVKLPEEKDPPASLSLSHNDSASSNRRPSVLDFKHKEESLEKEPIDFSSLHSPASSKKETNYILQASSMSVEAAQESKLPSAKIICALNIQLSAIHRIFQKTATKSGFGIIEAEEGYATAVYRKFCSFKKLLSYCFTVQEDDDITAVKMEIGLNEAKCVRQIRLKGLYGSRTLMRKFIARYTKLLDKEKIAKVEEERRTKGGKGKGSAPYNRIHTEEDQQREEGSKVSESSSYYIFHKILSSPSYTLGKNIAEYMEFFPLQYKNIEESAQLLPQPLEGIMSVVNETVKSFFQQYNYGKSGTRDFMMYCRPSVEKYVFSRLYDRVYAMYKAKNEEADKEYLSKKELIKTISSMDLFKMLNVPSEYIPLTEEEEKAGKKPYEGAIQTLNRIEKSNSPGEKVKDIMRMYAEMKATVVDHTKGKAELQSVEDQRKVFTYIIANSTLVAPATELNLLRDYLTFQEIQCATEQFVISNLQASLIYFIQVFDLSISQ